MCEIAVSNEPTVDQFAQLVEQQTIVWELAGPNPSETNTHSLHSVNN